MMNAIKQGSRTAVVSLVVAFAFALVACGSNEPEATTSDPVTSEFIEPGLQKPGATSTPPGGTFTTVQVDRIEQFVDIPPPLGPDADPPHLSHDEVRERINLHVPSFGGSYASEDGNLVIILGDESETDRAIAAVAAYLGVDRVTDTVLVRSGGYSITELIAWTQTARDLIQDMDGVFLSYLDEEESLIRFGVVSEKTAEQGRAALRGSGIPESTVQFDVKGRALLDEHIIELVSPQGIEISLEAPAVINLGEKVKMAIILTNTGEETVEFIYGANSPDDILVFRDGVEVWSKNGRVGGRTLEARTAELDPGETLRFDTEWDVTNRDFEPLPPGDYTIAATIWINEERPVQAGASSLATEPVPLTVIEG